MSESGRGSCMAASSVACCGCAAEVNPSTSHSWIRSFGSDATGGVRRKSALSSSSIFARCS